MSGPDVVAQVVAGVDREAALQVLRDLRIVEPLQVRPIGVVDHDVAETQPLRVDDGRAHVCNLIGMPALAMCERAWIGFWSRRAK